MAGTLSPLMINASAGLVANTGLRVDPDLTSAIDQYQTLLGPATYQQVLTDADGELASGTIDAIEAVSDDGFYPIFNRAPVAGVYTDVINTLETHVGNILTTADYSKFVTIWGASQGYCATSNQWINSAVTANKVLGPTFEDMDSLTTGGWSTVSDDISSFGTDLTASGLLIDFANIENFGLPSALLSNIKKVGNGFVGFEQQLTANGIDSLTVSKIGGKYYKPSWEQEKQIYTAMTQVSGDQLQLILDVMLITTQDIVNLSDLLDITKIFPSSFTTLKSPTTSGNILIFGSNGTLDPAFQDINIELGRVTGSVLADSATAFSLSVRQIKNIKKLNVVDTASALGTLETNSGLTAVNALTAPLGPGVESYFTSTFGTGTGTNGTFVLADMIGSIAGIGVTDNLVSVNEFLQELSDAGLIAPLSNSTDGVFQIMLNTIAGDYGPAMPGDPVIIPGGLPGAGTYANKDLAFTTAGTGLIAALETEYNALIAGRSTEVTASNGFWTNVYNKLSSEQTNLVKADVTLGSTPSGPTTVVLGWAQGLSRYAEDTTTGGPSEIITAIADSTTLTGQSIIGALREMRNTKTLQDLGIPADNLV